MIFSHFFCDTLSLFINTRKSQTSSDWESRNFGYEKSEMDFTRLTFDESYASYSSKSKKIGVVLFCLFSFEATESDSELLASNHSSSIAKRAEKGNRQNKNKPSFF
ncbi:MAG: hypothetical protein US25_C0029G0004 [Candidatus Moranbacteria bacterium GW2011_GWE1_36_7]|nr:MAG: hypothetical protein UR99_C0018G0004 [Candidatus Moranbacteria bacterium GW2011_GWD2_36_12]KKQ06214.1 MAG: hypothetical protein US16_C0021G0004 [Candidatus Moranbacteria bacterium GW2011_GWE2_36_40]KKQ14156.1 MAG: hypothetical protein US25_C0029G0004 [Candidatus Moranbacteria bacterium GW2011_GWE1_36_7]